MDPSSAGVCDRALVGEVSHFFHGFSGKNGFVCQCAQIMRLKFDETALVKKVSMCYNSVTR